MISRSLRFSVLALLGFGHSAHAEDFISIPWSDIFVGPVLPTCEMMPDCDPPREDLRGVRFTQNDDATLYVGRLGSGGFSEEVKFATQLQSVHRQRLAVCIDQTPPEEYLSKCFSMDFILNEVLDRQSPVVSGGRDFTVPNVPLEAMMAGGGSRRQKIEFLEAVGLSERVLQTLANGSFPLRRPLGLTPAPTAGGSTPNPGGPLIDPICTVILCAPGPARGICEKCNFQLGEYFSELSNTQTSVTVAKDLLTIYQQ